MRCDLLLILTAPFATGRERSLYSRETGSVVKGLVHVRLSVLVGPWVPAASMFVRGISSLRLCLPS